MKFLVLILGIINWISTVCGSEWQYTKRICKTFFSNAGQVIYALVMHLKPINLIKKSFVTYLTNP